MWCVCGVCCVECTCGGVWEEVRNEMLSARTSGMDTGML